MTLPQHHVAFADGYRQDGHWRSGTVPDHLAEWAVSQPDALALVDRGKCLSYAELDQQVDRAAGALQSMGFKPGNVLALQLPNWKEFVIFQQAAVRAGGAYLPIPPQLRGSDIEYILAVTSAWGIVVPSDFRGHSYQPMLAEIRDRLPNLERVLVVGACEPENFAVDNLSDPELEDVAFSARLPHVDETRQIIFTSGTESKPKGVVHSYNTSFFVFGRHKKKFALGSNDRALVCSTVGHATGAHFGVELCLYLGAAIVLLDRWEPTIALDLIRAHECTFMWGASTFYGDMVNAASHGAGALPSFRLACTAGAPIPSQLILSVRATLGARLVTAYGQSEGHNISVSDVDDPVEKVSSSDGRVNHGVDFKIVDASRNVQESGTPGEFAYRGPNVCLGYIEPEHMKNAFDDEGFIYSGDLAIVDNDRYLKIVGRRKEIIIRGGENISPLEIEDVIYKHPAVMDAAVIGVPHDRLGQTACAVVTLKEGKGLTLAELLDHFVGLRVAKYKTPEQLILIEEFPRTPSGKIKKEQLKNQLLAMNAGGGRHAG